MRWIPGIDVDRARLRTTLTYRIAPTLTAGEESNPLADDVGLIANGLVMPEQNSSPALIVGTSSDRIGTPCGRSLYGIFSKNLESWTGLPIAPYGGASHGTFDDELVAIGGGDGPMERAGSTSSSDAHDLDHIVETTIGDRRTSTANTTSVCRTRSSSSPRFRP